MPGTSCAEGGVNSVGRWEEREERWLPRRCRREQHEIKWYVHTSFSSHHPAKCFYVISSPARGRRRGLGPRLFCLQTCRVTSIPFSSHAQQAELRTRTLPMGDAPQRRMGKVWQLCYQSRGSQAPAPCSSSCHIPHGGCGKEPVCQGEHQAGLLEHPFMVCIPLPSHGDGPAGSPRLYSLLPSLA